jgi:hypothetical protein
MCAAAHGWVYDWQTLIAGLLALLAGGVTVWGTLIAANRQVKAAKTTADRQVDAAQEQVRTAQRMERRRISREGYAFYAMLVAAMDAVIKDIQVASQISPQ